MKKEYSDLKSKLTDSVTDYVKTYGKHIGILLLNRSQLKNTIDPKCAIYSHDKEVDSFNNLKTIEQIDETIVKYLTKNVDTFGIDLKQLNLDSVDVQEFISYCLGSHETHCTVIFIGGVASVVEAAKILVIGKAKVPKTYLELVSERLTFATDPVLDKSDDKAQKILNTKSDKHKKTKQYRVTNNKKFYRKINNNRKQRVNKNMRCGH